MGIAKSLIALKLVPKYVLFLAKLKEEGRPFLEGISTDLSSKLSLTYGGNLTIINKVLSSSFYSVCGNREHPGSFQNKIVSSSFK